MERLTMIDGIGNDELVRCMGCGLEKAGENLENCGFCEEGWQKALKKLAAYENTGLEPEDILSSANMKAIDKQTMLDLIVEAKRANPETGSFAEWLAEYLVEHLPTLTPPNEWVSVEERLPTDEHPVLVFVGYADTMTGFITTSSYFCFDENPHWQWDGLVRDEQRTLFWMPLPALPDCRRERRKTDEE